MSFFFKGWFRRKYVGRTSFENFSFPELPIGRMESLFKKKGGEEMNYWPREDIFDINEPKKNSPTCSGL